MVAAAVDRLGRNVVDCLNTGYKMRDEKKLLVTHGYDGPWNLDDPADGNRFTMEACRSPTPFSGNKNGITSRTVLSNGGEEVCDKHRVALITL